MDIFMTMLTVFSVTYVVWYILVLLNLFYRFSQLPPYAQMRATIKIAGGVSLLFLVCVSLLIARIL